LGFRAKLRETLHFEINAEKDKIPETIFWWLSTFACVFALFLEL